MKKLYIVILSAVLLFPAISFSQGCMEAKSEDGVNVMGYLQPQWEYNQNKGDATNNFYFQRARIGVMGEIPYDFSYYALAEFSPKIGGPYLLDFFITWKRLGPLANITVGQFKQPFGLELSTPCQKLYTVQRSKFVNEMASPFRDLGVMIYGGYALADNDYNLLDWNLALTNGTGANMIDNNRNKTITARLVVSPLDFVHIGGSFKTGKVLPEGNDDKLTRYGADISVEKYNFLFQGEYIGGSDDGFVLSGGGCGEDPTITPADGKLNKSGYAALLLYKTPWNIEPLVKYESYNPDTDGSDNLENSFTFGFNYFFNEWTRLQANYVINDYASVTKDDDAIYLQLQVIF